MRMLCEKCLHFFVHVKNKPWIIALRTLPQFIPRSGPVPVPGGETPRAVGEIEDKERAKE
jgi:hypothetical protein